MSDEEKNIDSSEKKDKKRRRESVSSLRGSLMDLIDGTVLTKEGVIKQLPFILFLAFLAMFYIGNRYHAEKIVRESTKLQNELKELRAKKIAVESELMHISKQSEVAKSVEKYNLGLKESVEPPLKITVKKD